MRSAAGRSPRAVTPPGVPSGPGDKAHPGERPTSASDVGTAVTEAFRAEWGRVLAAVARSTGDLDLAEECAQEAFATALRTWARDGVPQRPGAWLTTTARNHALDRLRRRRVEGAKVATAARLAERVDGVPGTDGTGVAGPDPVGAAVADALDEWPDAEGDEDLLRLVFACCHPALPLEGRVALTLRSLTGMTTAQVARAFLVPETTMAQRLTRAKRRIRSTGITFRVPPPELLRERVSAVLAVLYVLFTEGYDAWAEPAQHVAGCAERRALADDAVRCARLVARLLPDEPEARGLLALLLLQHARRDARLAAPPAAAPPAAATVPVSEPVLLEEQDRTLWRGDEIAEGLRVLDDALAERRPGPYQVQAAIAALHSSAPSAGETDWAEIVGLYDVLVTMTPSPVVLLNRAVAVAMLRGPDAGLEALGVVADAPELAAYHLLPATRADLLRRAGRPLEAATELRRALALVDREGDRRLLARRLAEVGAEPAEAPRGAS
ncbi:sigma-70 family RNA polymerase sigma factor [Antribacter sp. KLBMP9083]|uniref:Sigma-70 family RNA polymerase sigma factor n=1 Tax=Antribacter soli TaxID=2910976 RepID=A0AA41QDD5_9MICO|nr:sigma-70 family RNA polymerase sigma factor [Antribacter soli]MCF4120057.1 sigma-70 family RNA polymerase sigma factor [Antribacter soli]